MCVFLLALGSNLLTAHNSFRKGGACGKLKATPPAAPPETPAPIRSCNSTSWSWTHANTVEIQLSAVASRIRHVVGADMVRTGN